ncbi:TRAP transporter large permease [Mesorhizobium sp. J18]|uniref:TRAP transporter large permease n=1 Tax=Mesorhizobium sp. J18 TaxID=935263 RepID=UPI001FEFC3B9|nr:TRAP transporter large permease [Mesorhizobium sp. J18]
MAVFISLLTLGMSIPFAIGLPSLVYLYIQGGIPLLKGIGLASWGSMNSFILTAIPLFILMAEILQRSGMTLRVYHALATLFSRIPGGLLQTNIIGCAAFGSISGSSITTAASIGSVALPELTRRKYDPQLSAGSLAAGGTLGILIPPSLAIIIYSSFTETSVAKLFMAGVIPGLLLTLMFVAYIAWKAIRNPEIAPKTGIELTWASGIRSGIDLLPFGFLIGITLGFIYFGIATVTEAAAIGCLGAIVLSAVYGKLTIRNLLDAFESTVMMCGNILFIVLAAYLFAYAISYAGIGEELVSLALDMEMTKFEFYVFLFIIFTILGALVESVGMIVITVPLLFPLLEPLGIDPIWFGILVVVYIELGQITPPLGINLFVVQAMWKGTLKDVVIGTIPFHLLMFVLLAMLMIWPELALWLPSKVYQ